MPKSFVVVVVGGLYGQVGGCTTVEVTCPAVDELQKERRLLLPAHLP